MKIKILFYSHSIDFAGTWRSHERILLNLDKSKFDVYVFYNPNQKNDRLEFLQKRLTKERIIPFSASINKYGPRLGYAYKQNDFAELALKMNFDIIHFARGGYFEWPFTSRMAPIQLETNIFGGKDKSNFIDYSVTICDRITQIRGKSDNMIYNPIPLPHHEKEDLRAFLGIPDDYHVFGRIGRKANYHPISLLSLKKLKFLGYNFKYLIIGGCDKAESDIKRFGLSEDCIIIDTTNDDDFINKFHNTIDVFLHYRSDGECHSTSIAQAMMHGIPVISHYAGYNGQKETISQGGYVAISEIDYFNFLLKLIDDKYFYNSVSRKAKWRAMDFEQSIIVSKWEKVYFELFEINKSKSKMIV